MKKSFLKQLDDISENDYASLMGYIGTLIESITPYFLLGIDDTCYQALNSFRTYSQELLNIYDSPETHQQDDTYWLLYWATVDTSLQTTYNGYNYLHMLLNPMLRMMLFQIRFKSYIESIIVLIKKDNFIHSNEYSG